MFNYEKDYFDIKEKIPEPSQKVIVYINDIDEFRYAVFKDGKFYNDDDEYLGNITKWIENINK
jgi:hypothetical protein